MDRDPIMTPPSVLPYCCAAWLLLAFTLAYAPEGAAEATEVAPETFDMLDPAEAEATEPSPSAKPPRRPPRPIPGTSARHREKADRNGNGPKQPIQITSHRPSQSPMETVQLALLKGDTEHARQIYERMLRLDPHDLEALSGLALLHLHLGNPAIAEPLISKALSLSPRDPQARALQITLRASNNTSPQIESELKQLLTEQSTAAPLHFVLGNLYARQGRWKEAQQAYFDAATGDHGNPDYLFNLAISLEHIQQTNAAQQYYRAALIAKERRPAAFDRATLVNRIDILERAAP